jgi:hypothetical protein
MGLENLTYYDTQAQGLELDDNNNNNDDDDDDGRVADAKEEVMLLAD